MVLFANGVRGVDKGVVESNGRCQIMDLTSSENCKSFSQYPLNVSFSGGAVVDGHPLICGGGYGGSNGSDRKTVSECYMHDRSTDSWRFLNKLHTSRQFHAAVPFKDGLWVSGGMSFDTSSTGAELTSTEFVHVNGSIRRGPNLPGRERVGHCAVDLLDGRAMIIGGIFNLFGSNGKEVLIYHSSNDSFTSGPPSLDGRVGHSCVLFRSPKHDDRLVVLVAGSVNNFDEDITSEVLDFTQPSAVWEPCEY